MKIKLIRTIGPPHGFTTVGYWSWSNPDTNTGTLTVEVAELEDWRFSLAVIGHEFLEAFWCWVRGISTSACDRWDEWFEGQYSIGAISKEVEAGDDPRAPYHRGHRFGVWFEYFVIYVTFASWQRYSENCNRVMGINPEN